MRQIPQRQSNKYKSVRNLLFTAIAVSLLLTGCGQRYFVLHPVGPVGRTELHLITLSTVLVLIVIVPVIVLLAIIVVRYRDKPGNKAPYQPEWADNKVLEIVWWAIPIIIIGVLGTLTAKTTFALVRPPESNVKPITIDVTSLDWKWLFEYPGQNVATVNYCEIPTGVPVNFVLTSDAPMNSFWVPQLGGQEYTMPGMAMRLWLQADKPGTYYGHGANFTGKGFAHMSFNVIAKSQSDFNAWVQQVKSASPVLTKVGYENLKKPSVMGTVSYSAFPAGLFDSTIWAEGGRYMPKTMKVAGTANRTSKSMAGMSSGTEMFGNSTSNHASKSGS